MNARIYEIQAAEAHKDVGVEIHFEHDDKLFKPRKYHVPVKIIIGLPENKAEKIDEPCLKCIVM